MPIASRLPKMQALATKSPVWISARAGSLMPSFFPDQPAQRLQIDGIHGARGRFFLGRLQDHRPILKAPIVDEQAKRFQAEATLADVRMAIDAASLSLDTIVEMKRAQPVQPDQPVKFSD